MDELVYASNTTTSYTHLFNFEKNFVPQDAQMWMEGHFPYCFLYCALYAILISGGKLYMSNRPKYDLRRGLVMWSASLALFSITAVYRTMPSIFHLVRHRGLHYNICVPNINEDLILGYWSYLFALSKLVEFGDTFFIVLRKQPLIFLHWYHHIVTFLYSWLSYVEDAAYARLFAFINGFIHSFMYIYYTFKAMGYHPPRWLAMTITLMQLSQMFVGSFLTTTAYYYVYIAKVECHVTPLNITVAGIIF
ncbi:hypothetical protein E2986_13621 [Frieseomelitta varia]|uniref:Elongation of very long chain fatty acids protein n=1 Tax=Frieseomelitta varia TaxID=561572 RepID=A0A833SCC2_9HYME|nr:elongation of very long chain fatty acids protein 6-like [Frieseomelitta varia]KAF3429560.1 hypothetical protein E2986_13621 [Frieseomelitta varia]